MMDNGPDLLIVELAALFHDLSGEYLAAATHAWLY